MSSKKRARSKKSYSRRDYDYRREGNGSRTGGTGDYKPQVLTIATDNVSAAGKYVHKEAQLPVPRFGPSKGKATIMEILWIDFYVGVGNMQQVGVSTQAIYLTTTLGRANAADCTIATLAEDLADEQVIAAHVRDLRISTTGAFVDEIPYRCDMTDENGNGVLIGADRMFLVVGDVGAEAVYNGVAKIGYRLVNVGIAEYVGIMQSNNM